MDNDPLDIRRRRARFRATHRGTKEMDWLLGRYAEAKLPAMDAASLDAFEQFLSISDPDLNAWILNPDTIGDRAFGPLIFAVREFHGLDESTAGAGT